MSKEKPIMVGPGFFYGGVRAEIRKIEGYVETVASAFRRESQTFHANVAKQAENLPEHALAGFHEDGYEEACNLSEHFPAFAWQTTFVAIYSFLEDEMLGLGRLVGQHLGITLDPEELKDKGIFAAKRYLEALCQLTFPEGKHPWQEVQHYNRIRNAIVHSRGCIFRSKKEKDIRKYIEGKKSVCIDRFDRLQLSREFCLEVLENMEALLDDLFKLAQARVC